MSGKMLNRSARGCDMCGHVKPDPHPKPQPEPKPEPKFECSVCREITNRYGRCDRCRNTHLTLFGHMNTFQIPKDIPVVEHLLAKITFTRTPRDGKSVEFFLAFPLLKGMPDTDFDFFGRLEDNKLSRLYNIDDEVKELVVNKIRCCRHECDCTFSAGEFYKITKEELSKLRTNGK